MSTRTYEALIDQEAHEVDGKKRGHEGCHPPHQAPAAIPAALITRADSARREVAPLLCHNVRAGGHHVHLELSFCRLLFFQSTLGLGDVELS